MNVTEVARAYFPAWLVVEIRDTTDPKDIRSACVAGRHGCYGSGIICFTTEPHGVVAWRHGEPKVMHAWALMFATVRGAGTDATLDDLRAAVRQQRRHTAAEPEGPAWRPYSDETPEYLAAVEAFREDVLWPHRQVAVHMAMRTEAARDAFWESGRNAPTVGQLDLLDMLVGAP